MLELIYKDSKKVLETLAVYDLQEELEDLIIAIYGVSDKDFDANDYNQMVEHIKASCDYSIMTMNSACIFAALLLIRYEYPFSKVAKLKKIIYEIRGAGFRSRVSNYMAFILLEVDDLDDRLLKASIVYKEIQMQHGLITGEDDYVATIYLASLSESPETIITMIEGTYHELATNGFKKGNALQNLSHQLTVMMDGTKEDLLKDVIALQKQLSNNKVKFNASQYVLYGLIGYFVDDYELCVEHLIKTMNRYKSELATKRLRTIQLNVVVINCMKDYLNEKGLSFETLDASKKLSVEASLMLLLMNYLFRERLI